MLKTTSKILSKVNYKLLNFKNKVKNNTQLFKQKVNR